MTELLAVSAIAAAASSVAGMGIWSWTRLHPRRNSRGVCDEFSMERYEPMARLLAPEDVEFLRDTVGARMAARWARDRRRIFRLYWRDLASTLEPQFLRRTPDFVVEPSCRFDGSP